MNAISTEPYGFEAFELADVVSLTKGDPRRIQVWFQRGIIDTMHRPSGRGSVRKYTKEELLHIWILLDLSAKYKSQKLETVSALAKTCALLLFQNNSSECWVAIKADGSSNGKAKGFLKSEYTAEKMLDEITNNGMIAADLSQYRTLAEKVKRRSQAHWVLKGEEAKGEEA